MKRILLLLIIAYTSGFSQNCYHVAIQKNDKEYKTSNFYFKTVIDARVDSGKIIGEVYNGHLNILHCASFKKNLKVTVRDFLQKTYTNKTAPAYLVKVNVLSIEEILTKNQDDIGKANAELEFYRYSNNNDLIFITKISKSIEDKYPDATYSHDNRLKRILLSSVSEFEKTLGTDSSLFNVKISQSELEKIQAKNPDSLSKKIITSSKETFKFIMQLHCYGGTTTKGVGLRIGNYFFLKEYPKVAIGPSVFWDYFTLNKSVKVAYNVAGIKYNIFDIGLISFIRLNKHIGITIDACGLFGKEIITTADIYEVYYITPSGLRPEYVVDTKTTSEFISGFHAEQGVQFMRKEKKGVNLKLSVYESILTARYYENDIGLKLTLGINF